MLAGKRDLAGRVVGTGEKWITELGNDALRELFALSRDVAATASEEDGEGNDDPAVRAVRRSRPARRRAADRAEELQP
jgi:hypothetical protein